VTGFTFDAGPLIALDRNDRRVLAILARASQLRLPILIPSTALAQAMRNPARQARLSRLIRQPDTHVVRLDTAEAILVGRCLARANTSDIADAHVVVTARRFGTLVVTSDPSDLRRLAPDVQLVSV
jgi:predicted nucleic acid-binding protein